MSSSRRSCRHCPFVEEFREVARSHFGEILKAQSDGVKDVVRYREADDVTPPQLIVDVKKDVRIAADRLPLV